MDSQPASFSGDAEFGIIFNDSPAPDLDGRYLLVSDLSYNPNQTVQLVRHAESGHALVRKIRTYAAGSKPAKSERHEDAIMSFLRDSGMDSLSPLTLMYFIGAVEEVHNDAFVSQVSYFNYYNGGKIAGLISDCHIKALPIENALVVRLMADVLSALGFMYTRSPPVLHNAVGPENLLLDWFPDDELPRFVLGGFGSAVLMTPEDDNGSAVTPKVDTLKDIRDLRQYIRELLRYQESINEAISKDMRGLQLHDDKDKSKDSTSKLAIAKVLVLLCAADPDPDNYNMPNGKFREALETALEGDANSTTDTNYRDLVTRPKYNQLLFRTLEQASSRVGSAWPATGHVAEIKQIDAETMALVELDTCLLVVDEETDLGAKTGKEGKYRLCDRPRF